MKKELPSQEYLIDWWLEKYHNTNLEKVKEEHPEWAINPKLHSREFYATYPVTQEQHDEWNKWAKDYVRKVTGYSKKIIEMSWWSVYLNCSPNIIKDDNGKN